MKLPEGAGAFAVMALTVVGFSILFYFGFRQEEFNYCMTDCAGRCPKATDTVEESAAKLDHCRKLCELRKR